MKMKKLLSGALAAALSLSLSLSVPAFASGTMDIGLDGLAEGATVEITGETKTATVKVTVPTTGKVVLNPYELEYEVDATAHTTSRLQIISTPQYIVNESDLPVKVTTKVTGTIEGSGDFSATNATALTDKKVHLEFKIGATSNGTTESTSYETKALAKTATPFTDITMDKKGGSNPAVSFKFTGDAAKNPSTPWTTDDIIGATIVFTFALDNSGGGTPPATIGAQMDNATLTLASGTQDLTVSLTNAGTDTIASVAWSSSDTSAATVAAKNTDTSDGIGTVTFVASGTTTITAAVTTTAGKNLTATCNVTCS